MRLFFLLFISIISWPISAQELVMYDRDFTLNEGIYLTFNDLQNNRPIPKNAIETRYDPKSQEFYYDLLSENSIKIRVNSDSVIELNTQGVWGFCRNGNVYVNYSNDFYRIPVLGSISHFVAIVEIIETGFYDPWYGMPADQTRSELQQFMLDFDTGSIYDYTLENFISLLRKDDRLHREFIHLKKRHQRQKMFIYLRRYNEAHPIYFPAR